MCQFLGQPVAEILVFADRRSIFTKGSTAIVFDCQAAGSAFAGAPSARAEAVDRTLKRGTY